MNNRFTKEEIVQKGSMPYFPFIKIEKLLNVERNEILNVLADFPEIIEGAIVVEDFHKGEKEMYLNPVGCHLLIDLAPVEMIGKKLKQISKLIKNGICSNLTQYTKRLLRISPPLLKAMYEWSDLGDRYNFDLDHEGGPEPVQ